MVGEKIRQLRQLKGFSQEYMANMLEMSLSGYGKIERNETDVSFSRLQQISELLEVDIAELVSFDSSKIFHDSHHNEYKDNSQHQHEVIYYQTINNEEQKELYERLLAAKDAEITLLRKALEGK
ncbi:MAG: helix-turn-helix transcriptional regulator [Bacteroidetes bacterium]|nr:helix-turn-helix transcriptional regulator [Bacteroidota bacterium]